MFYIDLRQVGVEVCIRTSDEVLKVACWKLLSPNWHFGRLCGEFQIVVESVGSLPVGIAIAFWF